MPDPQKRFDQIVDTAHSLFLKNGYEQTSVQQIIEEVNIAKGTFYHYFNSKEDLLEVIVDKTVQSGVRIIEEAVGKSKTPVDQINSLFQAAANWKRENINQMMFIFKALYSPENLRFRISSEAKSAKLSIKLLEKILETGLADGSFQSAHRPQLLAELIIGILHQFNQLFAEEMLQQHKGQDVLRSEMRERIDIQEEIICKLLHLPAGSVTILDREVLDFFLAKLASSKE